MKAVILDWAGTAVDYGCMGPVSVFIDVFKMFQINVTVPEARQFMGLTKKDHILKLCRLPGIARQWEALYQRAPNEKDVDTLFTRMEKAMVSTIPRYSDPIPGLVEFVHAIRSMGMKIGSTTGYTRPMMEALAPAARKKGYTPDCIACSSDVPQGRPLPFMCYRNAIDLNVYPFEAMVKIGDTISDIEEGLNAGMWTVGVALTGNEMGMTESEVSRLTRTERSRRVDRIKKRFKLSGAHYAVDGIWNCAQIVNELNHHLTRGEQP